VRKQAHRSPVPTSHSLSPLPRLVRNSKKDVFLTPSYFGPTRILLPSYPRPDTVLLASYFVKNAEKPRNRLKKSQLSRYNGRREK